MGPAPVAAVLALLVLLPPASARLNAMSESGVPSDFARKGLLLRRVVSTYLASQRRMLRALRRTRAWRAVEDLAGELFDLARVSPERAVEIMEAARVPRSGLPVDALPLAAR